MDLQDWPYRLKSARRKKRLVKKDREKNLIQLDKQGIVLEHKRRELPMIPLEYPYQRGWKRFFVLREDIQQSKKAGFYQEILNKINTVQYHHDKNFKRRKRRRWRYHYQEKPQQLRELSEHEWATNKLKLTDDEKACFYRKELWNIYNRGLNITYAFAEAWRFALVVRPHIVYEAKMLDAQLESDLKRISNQIRRNHLWPKISRLKRGNVYKYWKWRYEEQPKYINKLKNKPRYTDKEMYRE